MNGRMGIAMMDLDDFKLYNDTLGHNAGDMVLKTVAREIQACIRRTDILIRFGGDEFLLLLPDIDETVFAKKLRQIQKRIYDAEVPEYSWLHISASIGGALKGEEPIEETVARADQLMYQAKQKKNMIVTDTDKTKNLETTSKQRVLIVDDSEINREMLAEMLKDDFDILEAASGEECVEMLQKQGTEISVILLDVIMSGMDGFDVLEYMDENHWIKDIPVIVISKDNSIASVTKAYRMGASEYIGRPFDAQVIYQRVCNVIKLYAKQRRLIALVTEQIYEKEKNERVLVDLLSQIVELRNGENGVHIRHMHILTEMLLEQLVQKTDRYKLNWSDQLVIKTASALHDIGKIDIPTSILNKPGKLTQEEFETMKTHTTIGAIMIRQVQMEEDDTLIQFAYEICRWHHEKWDGKGYPDGLKGNYIPISAQVVSIADVYDALVSERVYKKAYSHEKAIEMIINGECGKFNPLLIQCLKDCSDRIQLVESKNSRNRVR